MDVIVLHQFCNRDGRNFAQSIAELKGRNGQYQRHCQKGLEALISDFRHDYLDLVKWLRDSASAQGAAVFMVLWGSEALRVIVVESLLLVHVELW